MRTIKAITVHQPHALLLAHGVKTIETRYTPLPEKFIGEDFIIHAGKDENMLNKIFEHLGYFHQQRRALEPDTFLWHFARALKDIYPDATSIRRDWFAFGAALAVGTIVESAPASMYVDYISAREKVFGMYDGGDKPRYGWRFENVRLFKEPYPCRGQQFIWGLNIDLNDHIEVAF